MQQEYTQKEIIFDKQYNKLFIPLLSKPTLSLTFNDTSWPSLISHVTSSSIVVKRPMSKFEMLQLQCKSLTTITNRLEVRVEDQEALLKAKVYVSIHQKNAFKVVKLKATKKCGVI